MLEAREADTLSQMQDALRTIVQRIRELERLCRETAELAERVAEGDRKPRRAPGPGAPVSQPGAEPSTAVLRGGPGTLDPRLSERQGALLVAVTLRGGTVDASLLASLAGDLGLGSAALDELFSGTEPHLTRRSGGAAGITERGIESAAGWRRALPAELLRLATDL